MNVLKSDRLAWLPGLSSGLIVGLVAMVMSVSFAALLFSGPLAPFLPWGLALALLSTALNMALVSALTGLPGAVGGTQSAPMAILAGAIAQMVAQIQWLDRAAGAPAIAPGSLMTTAVVAMGLTTLATGAAFLLLGWFRAGRLVRFLPYPVLGGVLAGSGWMLLQGALHIMTPPSAAGVVPAGGLLPLGVADLSQLALHGGPGLALAALLLGVQRRWPHPLSMLAGVVAGVLAFYAIAWALHLGPAQLAVQGWLLMPGGAAVGAAGGAAGGAPAWPVWQVGGVHWAGLLNVVPDLLTVPVVSATILLLNAAALETASRRNLDLDRELRVAGLANVVVGSLGGLPGYQQLGLSTMNLRAGVTERWVGACAAAVCLLALTVGAPWLPYLPRPVLGALLLFMALRMLQDWVMVSWGQLSKLDHGVVVLIVTVTALVGFLPAVLVGLAAALVLFGLRYSQIDVVRQTLSGQDYRSRLERPAALQALLAAQGAAIAVLQLQGYLFFGIADRLLVRARRRIDDPALPPLRYLLLDCRRVTGVDSSAAQSFARLHALLQSHQVLLAVCHPSAAVRQQLLSARVVHGGPGSCRLFDDLDHGLEWCEAQMLAAAPRLPGPTGAPDDAAQAGSLQAALAGALGGPAQAERLLAGLPRLVLQAGQRLITQDESADDLYLMDSGTLQAQRDRGGEAPMRLQTMVAGGHVIGEVAFYLGWSRTADVVALTDSVVYRLSVQHLQALEAEQPMLAAGLHRWVAQQLAARVAHLVSAVNALER